MIVIRVNVNVNPTERGNFVSFFKQEMIDVPQQFVGCERFHLYEDVQDPNAFLLYEEWQDQASFNAYKNSALFKQNGEKLFPMLAGSPDSSYFNAETIET